jgi:hypothetical protein
MPRFGLPNVKKLEAKGDVPGLIKALGCHKGDVRNSCGRGTQPRRRRFCSARPHRRLQRLGYAGGGC